MTLARRVIATTLAGAACVATLTLTAAPASAGPTENCGPAGTAHVDLDAVVVMKVIGCDEARALIPSFLQDPRVQAGDRSATVGGFGCRILGAAEQESLGGIVVFCEGPGYVYGVVPGSIASLSQDPD